MSCFPAGDRHPPPVGAWEKLTLHVANIAKLDGRWTAPLKLALEAAASALAHPSVAFNIKIQQKGWTDPEAMLHGWALDRRLEAILDRDADPLVFRPRARKQGPKELPASHSLLGPAHPPLFDWGG